MSVAGSTTSSVRSKTVGGGGPIIAGLNLCPESMGAAGGRSRCRTISRLEEELGKFYPGMFIVNFIMYNYSKIVL